MSFLSFIIFNVVSASIILMAPNSPQNKSQPINQFTGKAVNNSQEKDSQLEIYVRNCGFIKIPRNSKDEIPKEGELITITLGGRCKIEDWSK